jgi:hypothetical protein
MKRVFFISVILLLASAAWAVTSDPQGLPSASGDTTGGGLNNFQVLGEDVAGVTGNLNYVTGIGLAPMIYLPLTPTPGTDIPNIPAGQSDLVIYPNPFNPDSGNCVIAYKLSQDAQVYVYIMDMTGTVVKKALTSSANRGSDGYSRYGWDGTNGFGVKVSSGVYPVQLTSGGQTIGKAKIMAVR